MEAGRTAQQQICRIGLLKTVYEASNTRQNSLFIGHLTLKHFYMYKKGRQQ